LSATTITLNGVAATDFARQSQSNTFTARQIVNTVASASHNEYQQSGVTRGYIGLDGGGIVGGGTGTNFGIRAEGSLLLIADGGSVVGTLTSASITLTATALQFSSSALSASAPALRVGDSGSTSTSAVLSVVRAGLAPIVARNTTNTTEVFLQASTSTGQVGTSTATNFEILRNNSTIVSVASTGITVTGNVSATGDGTFNTSDRRFKENIVPIDNALGKVLNLGGYTYNKNGEDYRRAGVIAQEIQAVLPEAVIENEDGYLLVSHASVIALLVQAIKDLNAKVEELSKK
jgi:hypothetical protein